MNWTSIDVGAGKMGFCHWCCCDIVCTGVLSKYGKSGYKIVSNGETTKFDNKITAYLHMVDSMSISTKCFVEVGGGNRINVHKAQAHIRGYIEAACDIQRIEYSEINVNTWRRCIKDEYGISWQPKSEAKKKQGQWLVKEHYGLDVSEDEADSVLLGVAAMRMKLV